MTNKTGLAANEQRMLQFIVTCDDARALRQVAKNAALKSPEVARAAKLRLFAVLPSEEPGTLEYAVWQSIHALEEELSSERGKTIRLSRTRQKIGRQGEAHTVSDLVLGKPSDGFRMLADRDMLELSFEAVAIRFADRFSVEVALAARTRLDAAGFTV